MLEPPPPRSRLLKGAVSGGNVALLQSALQKAGFDPGPHDGVYGPEVARAVRAFQRQAALAADGVVGPATWSRLNDASGSALQGVTLRRPLHGASSGADVEWLQRALSDAGFAPGTADGVFGPDTERAVVRFQRAERLDADGLVGAETWERLVAKVSRVFVCYRRGATSGHAGRLYDRLVVRLGADRVFMDVEALEPGKPFRQAIREAIAASRVLVAVIGADWHGDPATGASLEDDGDFVRFELESAWSAGVRIIPVLIDDALLPGAAELPETMAELPSLQAVRLTHERFSAEADALVSAIEQALRSGG